ncbi:hypothetical protein BS614_01080 [Paenibacillus xylanexedens]|uniref:hypothetical protein n=1 Tax=Paenibacillus xylanexedens TaxID=528191 RepID=UPI0009386E02|nr:hypothetical protein [Paenibacillus xylanexedens]APO42814.1 hypothetical protein BS614_01080 [Paenibacillus xylanexedens]
MSPKRELNRFFLLVMYLFVIAVCLGACGLGPNQGPAGEPKRTDEYTLNSERRDLNEWVTKRAESFQKDTPDDYTLTATVDVSHESGVDRISYEILVNEARVPMDNVLQSFTLDPNMINRIDAGELFHSNVSNTHEISLESDKEPLGLSLSRSYVLKPKAEIDSNIIQRYADMYIKISYGPNDQRTEDYFYIHADPSPRTIEYMKSWEKEK